MKYFKWTPELESKLCELHRQGLSYMDISRELCCSFDSAKKIGSKYIKAGLLERRAKVGLPVEDVLSIVRKYRTRDNTPSTLVYQVLREFGTWEKALIAADLPLNLGGTMDLDKPTLLYLLKFGGFYKVGLTQRSLKQRFYGSPPFLVLDTYESSLGEVVALEREILAKVTKFIPEHPWFERNGKTECFISEKPLEGLEDLI